VETSRSDDSGPVKTVLGRMGSPAVSFGSENAQLDRPTDFVLIKLGNWLSRSGDRSAFVMLMAQLRSDPKTIIFPASRSAFDHGFALYERRPDKDWSFTDAFPSPSCSRRA
jgi:hypothetical protein